MRGEATHSKLVQYRVISQKFVLQYTHRRINFQSSGRISFGTISQHERHSPHLLLYRGACSGSTAGCGPFDGIGGSRGNMLWRCIQETLAVIRPLFGEEAPVAGRALDLQPPAGRTAASVGCRCHTQPRLQSTCCGRHKTHQQVGARNSLSAAAPSGKSQPGSYQNEGCVCVSCASAPSWTQQTPRPVADGSDGSSPQPRTSLHDSQTKYTIFAPPPDLGPQRRDVSETLVVPAAAKGTEPTRPRRVWCVVCWWDRTSSAASSSTLKNASLR